MCASKCKYSCFPAQTLGLKINVMQPRPAEPSNVAWHFSAVEICGLFTSLQPDKCLFSHRQWTNVSMWMYMWVGGVITVLISWLWVSGRLPAVQAHLVNEPLRSIEWKRVRGEKGERRRRKKEGICQKRLRQWGDGGGSTEAVRATPLPQCDEMAS